MADDRTARPPDYHRPLARFPPRGSRPSGNPHPHPRRAGPQRHPLLQRLQRMPGLHPRPAHPDDGHRRRAPTATGSSRRPSPCPGLPTVAQTFRDAGYQAYAVGKLHVYPQRDRIGFDDVILDEEGRPHLGAVDDYDLFLADKGRAGMGFAHGNEQQRVLLPPLAPAGGLPPHHLGGAPDEPDDPAPRPGQARLLVPVLPPPAPAAGAPAGLSRPLPTTSRSTRRSTAPGRATSTACRMRSRESRVTTPTSRVRKSCASAAPSTRNAPRSTTSSAWSSARCGRRGCSGIPSSASPPTTATCSATTDCGPSGSSTSSRPTCR